MNQWLRNGLIIVPLVFGLGMLLQNSGNAPSGAAVMGLVIIVVVASCIMLAIRALWGKRRHKVAADAGLVTICITAPMIAVPDISHAPRTLLPANGAVSCDGAYAPRLVLVIRVPNHRHTHSPRGADERIIERSEWQTQTLRQFKIGGIIGG